MAQAATKFEEAYELQYEIGGGATGRVWKCISRNYGDPYAVKICHTYSTLKPEDIRREISICKILNHGNIVTFLESFEKQGDFHLVFEMMTGGDVMDDIENRDMYTEYDASICIGQVFSGMYYLHQRNIIHRDMKPDNILIRRNGADTVFKIADFGSAIQCDGKTDQFGFKSTIHYCAPELFTPYLYGSSVDMWSCGVILYIALFGFAPFHGSNDDAIVDNIRRGEFKFYSADYCDPVSSDVKDLIRKLLNTDPDTRFTAIQALNHVFIRYRDAVASRQHRYMAVENTKLFNLEKRKCKSETCPKPVDVSMTPPPKSSSDGGFVRQTLPNKEETEEVDNVTK